MKKQTRATKRAIKTPKILVAYEDISKLATQHKCSKVTVYAALKYSSNSHRAQEIRKDALDNFGGIEIEENRFM